MVCRQTRRGSYYRSNTWQPRTTIVEILHQTCILTLMFVALVKCTNLNSAARNDETSNVDFTKHELWTYVRGEELNDGKYATYVTCPADGIIKKIEYSYGPHNETDISDKLIYSISFTCVSSHGESTIKMGKFNSELQLTVLTCPDYQHISYFYGYADRYVNDLNIVCANKSIPIGSDIDREYVHEFEQNDRAKQNPEIMSSPFDDYSYATEGRRRRPIKIKIYFREIMHSIQVRYGDTPVQYECSVSHIQVLEEDISIKEDGFEIIGFTSGSTCSAWHQQIDLEVQTSVNTNGTKMKYATGTSVHYNVPRIAILVGFKTKYRIDKNEIPVKHHYTCKGGSMEPTLGVTTLNAQTFDNVFFVDHFFDFNSTESCESAYYERKCVESIKINNFITHLDLLEKEFNKCFDPNAVTIPFSK